MAKARESELRRGRGRRRRKKVPWSRRWKQALSVLASFTIIAIVFLAGAYMYLRAQALPTAHIQQTSRIVDVNGQLIDAFSGGQNRSIVPLSQISPYAIQATIAIEDHRFFEHHGLDFRGLARAVYIDLKYMEKREGASTITQQLARNLYLTNDKNWSRKMMEAVYAIQLEMQYSKEDILQQYLNQIYYGHATYGIQAAAQLFFGKDAADLTLAESALLAGVPKGPRYYSPYYNEDNAKSRQKVILQTMVNFDLITKQQADQALAEPLHYKMLTGSKPSEAPYFRDYVRQLAIERYGIDAQTFDEGGITVYTSLDLNMQHVAEQVVKDHLRNSEIQGALIAIDPRNGYIKAMVGGKDYAESQFNRVFTTARQPGSSFKPFVYLTALETNQFTPLTSYQSAPTTFTYDHGRQFYRPSNFANKYENKAIDMREAIAKSDNIYAVSTLMDVGPEHVIETARRMGIDTPLKPLPSLALGTFPVSPMQMASAFGTLANGGLRVEPTAILKIVDSRGHVLYEATHEQTQVTDPAHAYVLTNLLESVFEPGGTGYRVAELIKRPVAGKTGTTDTDAWMVGYTPELATAVWVGYDQNKNISAVESHLASPIFAEFTERALEAVPPKLFPVPQGVVNVYIDPASGLLATADCPEPRAEVFILGTEPTEYCTGHSPVPTVEDPLQDLPQKRSWWTDLKRWWND